VKLKLAVSFLAGIHDAVALLLPLPDKRIIMTEGSVPTTLIPGALIFVLACLARTPGTHALRLALLPVVCLASIHVAYGYVWQEEEMHLSNTCTLRLTFICSL